MESIRQYIRATVAYDGTDFSGFQWQATGRTVQGALEDGLRQVTQLEVRIIAAGRTDAGVHARGQVIGFQVAWRHALSDLHRALNAVLPEDVVLLDLALAPEGWHPRFSAVRRHYRYTVLNQALRDPLARRYAHLVTQPLCLELLQAASAVLVGEHDFASFGRPMQDGETTVRRILSAGWKQDGACFTFDVVGNAFLRNMVRTLVAAQLQVGFGAWTVEQLTAVLYGRDRAKAAPPAPACGLCLMHVDYDEKVNFR